ncbi:MAG: glycosyltransferase [Chthonomonas sp.]|nr:glycosyltransferase [Chthonomonas sp.]
MPKVSVLLTCYNHLAYLPVAVESIRAQTMIDFEVICLDDGSTDGTRDWLRANCPDWHLEFNAQNLGTYGSLNRGLALANGEFIAILNDDDEWMPTKLEQQLNLLAAEPRVGLVHTNGDFIGALGETLPGTPLGFDFPRSQTDKGIIPLIYANKIIASAVLVRRECFEQCGEFNPAYFGSGDWDMWLRIAEHWDIGFCNDKLTNYRWHENNASKKLDRIWRDDQMLRERILDQTGLYESMGLDEATLNLALAHNWACLGTVRTLNGDPSGGRRAYKESLRRQPSRWRSRVRWLATYLPKGLFRRLL